MAAQGIFKKLKFAGGILLIGAASYALWNSALTKLCTAPAYWSKIAENTNETCIYSPLASIFSLQNQESYNIVLIGDARFLEKAEQNLPANARALTIDTCTHDLRSTVGILNWSAKNLIAKDKPIIIQGGPQIWTNPGYFGARKDTQPWILSQNGKFPNKKLHDSCLQGFEAALQERGSTTVHERPNIDKLKFGFNQAFFNRAKRGLTSASEQIIWVDDREGLGENPQLIKRYEAWVKEFPADMGRYMMDMSALKSLTLSQG